MTIPYVCYRYVMGRKPRPGKKRLIRLRDEQWGALERIAEQLSAGGRKKWSVTEVVALAVDNFMGHSSSSGEMPKKGK